MAGSDVAVVVMARQCRLNTCPVGIATQDEKLRARFTGNPEMVMTYFHGVAGEVRERMAALGIRALADVIGAVEKLRPRNQSASHAVAGLLQPSTNPAQQSAKDLPLEIHLPETAKDIRRKLLRGVDGLKAFPFVHDSLSISNSDRSVGAHLSGHILRRTNFDGLAAGKSIRCEFRGSAGQSFGAFLVPGIRFRLVGDANDYVGKGLSGGTLAITAGAAASKRGDLP